MNPKGEVDGKQVNIPVPGINCMTDGVTQEDRGSARMEECVQAVRRCGIGKSVLQVI